jgi:hypothetical protein
LKWKGVGNSNNIIEMTECPKEFNRRRKSGKK